MPNSIDRTIIALRDLGKAVAIAFLALAALIAGPPPAKADDDGGIRLVTQNMYVGTSFAPLSATRSGRCCAISRAIAAARSAGLEATMLL